jgi:hypothetical protein
MSKRGVGKKAGNKNKHNSLLKKKKDKKLETKLKREARLKELNRIEKESLND